ncbi:MAG: DUF1786 domain-containing protein [Chloroflexi bacterium]|nr:DUF1786 domain-containing protein [Chloroflexota bacterium]
MRILCIDVGTGTQDILLFDSSVAIENCVQMIMPSATAIAAQNIGVATACRQKLLLTGVTMGGGPSTGALRDHLAQGLPAFATPDAARTFDDDLAEVEKLGVTIVSEDEAKKITGKSVLKVEFKDVDLLATKKALAAFGVELALDGLAVAVLDHGAAPPGVSDRLFRFEHLRRTVEKENKLTAFAYLRDEIPSYLTRMLGVAQSLEADLPLLVMDTGPAAALGALDDSEVASHLHRLVVNLGNMHTLAFHLYQDSILGLFEHHTGLLNVQKLDTLIARLVSGTLTQEEVFEDSGHGCYIVASREGTPLVEATGPRRGLMKVSTLGPHFAAPHGDVMLTGCFGLLRAFAQQVGGWREEILKALQD